MKHVLSRLSTLAAALALAGCAAFAPTSTAPVAVKVLAINDFHGNLLPPAGGIKIRDEQTPGKLITVEAGGAEYMHTAVAQLRAANPNHVFVAAGDLVGASPLLSALFHDEPTVESLSLMGLNASAVGNHEFDAGITELLRKQSGGCHPKDGCKGPTPFTGAKYQYLAASTIDLKTGKPVLPAYYIKSFQGIPMAFIGLTLKGTPDIVTPSGVAGLRFDDEAETVNRLVPELRAQGIEAIAVLIHEGGFPTGNYDDCPGISGPIVDIVKKLDKAVDLVISGHTHRAYNCQIDGRLVTSGDKYGTIVTDIDVQLDPKTRDMISARANNVIVRNARFAKAPEQSALIASYVKLSDPLIKRVVGSIATSFSRELDAAGSSTMGQLIADAQLAATSAPDKGGAVISLMNIGGVRESLTRRENGQVTFGDIFTVQPFSNNLVTVTMTGEQIRRLLEQQWRDERDLRGQMLQVSKGFSYSWDAARPMGSRVLPESIKLNGQTLQAQGRYRVSISNFLATGGDSFKVFTEAVEPRTGMMDVEVLEQYLTAHPNLSPAALDRVKRLN